MGKGTPKKTGLTGFTGFESPGNPVNPVNPVEKNSWPRVRLGDVCEEIHERTSSSLVSVDRYITTDNMLKNCAGVSVAEYVPKDVGLVRYAQGDVLLANIRPYLKKLWRATWNGGCSSDVVVFRSRSIELSSEYLFAALSQDRFFDYVMQKPRGTKMPRGDRDWMKGFEIPLPPLSVQHEIVARLERELGAVDKLAKKFEELEAAAEAEFKAELKETFEEISRRGEMHRRSSASEGRFGEAEPEGRASVCETRRLGDVCVIKTGKKDVRQGNPNGQYPFFTCAKIPTHSDTYSFDCSALLVAGNGDVGYTQKYVGKFEAYQRTYVLSCFSQDVDIDYLHHLMVGCFQSYAQQMIMGNTMPYIKMGVLENFEIPLPSLPIQREVVARLDAAKAKKEKLVAAARRGRETVALMRKAILKEAFE